MASISLVDRVHELSERLAGVLSLLPSEDPLLRASGEKDTADFLFEIVVLTELLVGIKPRATVSVVRRSDKIVLARKPAKKRNKTYFIVTFGEIKYELLHGIKVADRFTGTQAPDLTLQAASGDDEAEFSKVRAIWDAKLRGETGLAASERVSKGDLTSFLHMLDALAVPTPGDPRDVLDGWPKAFEVSGIISNGALPFAPRKLFLEKGCSATESFVDFSSHCQPSRAEHLGAKTSR